MAEKQPSQRSGTTPASPLKPSLAALIEALPSRIDPPPLSLFYRLALCGVALAMILLPAGYVVLLGGITWGLLRHALLDFPELGAVHGTASIRGQILLYLLPLFLGGTLLLFLVKPLFAPRPRFLAPRTIGPGEAPLLFALVERIARAVGAPEPREIHVDCAVNASASFRRGLFSFLGNDLILTVGLPLAQGLTVQQLAGVIAHELGHFTQGVGMRFTYVIRSINSWFFRVAYERDGWDESIVEASRSGDWRLRGVFYVARGLVWLSRLLLKGLALTGTAVSAYALRQMELDADRYEVKIAGSEGFEATMLRLPQLSMAHEAALRQVADLWSEKRLAEDFPGLVLSFSERIPSSAREKVAERYKAGKTEIFSTHPCDRDRVENARREQAKALLASAEPGTRLFRDFGELSRTASLKLYQRHLGEEAGKASLASGEVLKAEALERDHLQATLRRFLQRDFSLVRIPRLPPRVALEVGDLRTAAQSLNVSRQKCRALARGYREAFQRYDACDSRLLDLAAAESLLRAKLPVGSWGGEGPPPRTLEDVAARKSRQIAIQEELEPGLADFESYSTERLSRALELACRPAVRQKLRGSLKDLDTLDRLLETASRLGDCAAQSTTARFRIVGMKAVMAGVIDEASFKKLSPALIDESAVLARWLQGLRHALAGARSIDGNLYTETLIPAVPDARNWPEVYQAACRVLSSLAETQLEALKRLARYLEDVEASFGLGPVADPPLDSGSGDG